MKTQHWLAIAGIMLLTVSAAVPMFAEEVWSAFLVFAGIAVLSASVAAAKASTED